MDYLRTGKRCLRLKKFFLFLLIFVLLLPLASAKTTDEKIDDILEKTGLISKIFESVRHSISIHGTEYLVNETGKIFLQLTENDTTGNEASCRATVYFPNNTKFINYETMTFLENGIYYITTSPLTTTGVYMINAICIYPSRVLTSSATGSQILDGSNYANDYTSTHVRDLVYHQILSNPATADAKTSYFFLRPPTIATNSDIEQITLRWAGMHDVDGRAFNLYLFNYTSGAFKLITSTTTRKVDDVVVTTLKRENISGLVHSNGSSIVELDSINMGSGHYQFHDFLQLEFTANKTVYPSQIYGSEELNVHDFNALLTNQTEVLNKSIIAVNSSIFSKLFKIQDEIASVNDTVKSESSAINNTMNWWGNLLNTTINFWGNMLEAKLDSIVLGNVTVTASVDYDEIAITVMQYLKALQKQELI